MKKFFAILMTLALMLSLAVPAMAEDGYTLTLNGAQAGHTYTAYQIFAGDLSGNTLSNIVWGSGVTAAAQTNLGDAATKAESVKTTANAEAFAAEVAPYLGIAAGSVTIDDGATSGTISGLEAGYYLVKTTATPDKDGVYTYYIMMVVKNTNATIKADTPEIDKTVYDNDANIGDTVTFTLTATMPSNLQGYETYKVIFHDTLSAGLDFVEGTVKVTVAGEDKTSAFKVTEENGTLTISCDNVLVQGATTSSKIVVTYNAKLNAAAVIGDEGNPNKVYLEYSNDPNWDGEGAEPTGKTPEVEVEVYTWEIPVFKYTKDGDDEKALAGAGFTLYKNAECTTAVNLVATDDTTIFNVCNLLNCDGQHHIEDNEITTGSTGKFQIEGLEQGTYYLKETTTPAGYNTAAVTTVVIAENGKLNPETVNENEVYETEIKILNNAGATLPETGGMGTTIFYIVGGIMVVAAVVLLVTKKRMSAEG